MKALFSTMSLALCLTLASLPASSVPVPAPFPTAPGYIDYTYAGGDGFRAVHLVGPVAELLNRISIDKDGNSVVAGISGLDAFIGKFDPQGNLIPTFGNNGIKVFPNISIRALVVSKNALVLGGAAGKNAVLGVFNPLTGAPFPGCGDASGWSTFTPTGGYDNLNLIDMFLARDDVVTAVAVQANAAQSNFAGGLLNYDAKMCRAVTGFGPSGNGWVWAKGDFSPTFGVQTANGGTLLGGTTQIPGSNYLSAGVANFDAGGNFGTCGDSVKSIYVIPSQNFFPGGGFYDAGSDSVIFDGYSTPNGDPYVGEVQSNCNRGPRTWTYPTTPAFPTGIARLSPETIVVEFNELVNGQYVSRPSIYSINGGPPLSVSPPLKRAALATGDALGAGAQRAKAMSISSSLGVAIAIQPDAKILVAGIANGSASLLARYIGVERTGNVIEFYNNNLNHYFITADANEAAAIDGGSAGPGWSRTGQTWKSGGPDRVCRFYGSPDINPATGLRRGPNSHFYTISSEECAAVKLDLGWHFESYDFSGWPRNSDGSCPAGTIPVKRVYNLRFAQNDSNHRYTISDTIYNQMVTLGWKPEGVVFCSVL